MAITTPISNLKPTIWKELAIREAELAFSFFDLIGSDVGAAVRKMDIPKGVNEHKWPIVRTLQGGGVGPNETLEGKAESLRMFYDSMTLTSIAKSVELPSRLEQGQSFLDLPSEARQMLSKWFADYMSKYFVQVATTSSTNVKYGGNATSDATIDATDILDLNIISGIRCGVSDGFGRKIIPFSPVSGASPLSGKFVLLVPYNVFRDMKQSTEWKNVQKETFPMNGEGHPLAKAPEYYTYDGVVIKPMEAMNTANFTNVGGVACSKCLFIGAQAFGYAMQQDAAIWTTGVDRDRRSELVMEPVFGLKKLRCEDAVGTTRDMGVVELHVASTPETL